MKGCQTFEELQALGAEKIHERTHISRDKIELFLTKSYGEINKIQFMGFVSILEREYGLDMSEIKEEYLRFQEVHQNIADAPKQSVILQSPSHSKQKWIIGGLGLIVVLIVAGYLAQAKMANIPEEEVMQLSSAAVEVVDQAAELNASATVEANTSTEINATKPMADANSTKPQTLQNIRAAEGLEIRPVYKVWVGMIDVNSHTKTQTITKDPIKIDTSKNWLIGLGHGRIEIASSSGNEVLRESGAVWFAYENGSLKRLTKEEFITRNGGNNW